MSVCFCCVCIMTAGLQQCCFAIVTRLNVQWTLALVLLTKLHPSLLHSQVQVRCIRTDHHVQGALCQAPNANVFVGVACAVTLESHLVVHDHLIDLRC